MLFLAGVNHERYKRAKRTRQMNLPSATVSLQVVIGLCKRKETAALKIKAAASNRRVKLSAVRRLFSFAVVRQVVPYSSMCILQVQSYFEVKSILLICKAVKQKKLTHCTRSRPATL